MAQSHYEEVILVSEICPMSRSGVQRRGRGPMARSRVQCHGRGSNVAVAGQHTDALLPSHFPIVKGISAAKDFTLNDNRLKQLPKYAFRCLLPRKGRGGGTPDVQQTGIIKWAAKIKNQKKSLRLSTKPKKISGPKLSPPKIPCRISKP